MPIYEVEYARQKLLQDIETFRTAGALAMGKLGIFGWIYDIAQGTVCIYNEATGKFEIAFAPALSATAGREYVQRF